MKNDGVSANIADSDHRAMSGASEHSVTELASALAMMHATLEYTTDAILVTDEANYNEKLDQILPDMSWHLHQTGTSNFRLFMGPMVGTTRDFMLRNRLPILAARKYTLAQH